MNPCLNSFCFDHTVTQKVNKQLRFWCFFFHYYYYYFTFQTFVDAWSMPFFLSLNVYGMLCLGMKTIEKY